MKTLEIYKAFFIVAITLFVTTFNSNSQENEINEIAWIEKLKAPNVQDIKVIKMNDDVLIYHSCDVMDPNIYPGFIGVNKPHLYLVNRKTNEKIEMEIKLMNDGKRRAFEKLLYVNNSIHVFSSFINQDQMKYYVFEETINPETLEPNNDTRMICEIDFGKINDVYKNSVVTVIGIERGRISLKSRFRSKAGYHYYFNNFDSQINNKANYTYNTTVQNSYISNFTFDNNDNLYFIEIIINKKKVPNDYILYFYAKDNPDPKKQSISVENITSRIQMNVNAKNELLCGGLFAKAQQKSAIGAFSIVFPAHLEGNGKNNTLTFSSDFLTEGLDEKVAAKIESNLRKNKEFDEKFDYYVDTLNILSNGGFRFITEKKRIVRIPKKNGFDTYIYTFGDLYIFSCNEDGSFNWHEKIVKDQTLANSDRFMGHYLPYYDSNNNINIIYSKFTPKKFLGNVVGVSDDAKIVMTTLDSNGKKSDKILFTDKEMVKQITPFYSESCGNGKFILTRIEPFTFVVSYAVGEMILN